MRHLFIINPAARQVKGRIDSITAEISAFFKDLPDIPYEIYVSEWCRDCVTYIRRHIRDIRAHSSETVRIHSVGGTGTLFEVVNGTVGLSGTEIAVYPYGRTNVFLKYFKPFGLKPFASIHNQVFGETVPMDAIRCGNNYGICFGIAGLEAYCDAKGDEWIESGVPVDISFAGVAIPIILKGDGPAQEYRVEIDGQRLDGEYISVLIANTPCYGQNMYPGVDAHPDDGKLEIYLHGKIPKLDILLKTLPYLKGGYKKINTLQHFSGRRISLSSDNVMCLNIDSETFYATSIEYEIVPDAVRFVCPDGIDLAKLPLIYNKPEEGLRDGR